METKEYTIKDGIELATQMVTSKYLGSFMRAPKSGHTIISFIANGLNDSCLPYYQTDEGVAFLQNVLAKVVAQLVTVCVTDTPQSQETSPLCYGDDYVSKFKVLGKIVKLSYLFETCMGKSVQWRKHRLSAKSASVYNKFTPEELQQINDAIRTIAINLASIKLIPDNKE